MFRDLPRYDQWRLEEPDRYRDELPRFDPDDPDAPALEPDDDDDDFDYDGGTQLDTQEG